MPSFDSKTPISLLSIQKWFASIITRPIDSDSQMASISPSGRQMAEEAEEVIAPGFKLTSAERIQIYNQQYWWRLLSNMHQNFPTLTRLFGYSDFNLSIAMPYLTYYPSNDWSLSQLGNKLPQWIEEFYHADDKVLISQVAKIDWAYQSLFFAPPVEDDSQANVKLFKLPFDLFNLRELLLKEEVEHWMKADFPALKKERIYYFKLFRTKNNIIAYREIDEAEWSLLDSTFKKSS